MYHSFGVRNVQSHLKHLRKLAKAPILWFPEWSRKLHVHIDPSTIVRKILTQPRYDQLDHPNAYASRKLNKVEINHSTIEIEGIGMIFYLQKFQHYLFENPFLFYTDHQALKYLVNKPLHHGRICR